MTDFMTSFSKKTLFLGLTIVLIVRIPKLNQLKTFSRRKFVAWKEPTYKITSAPALPKLYLVIRDF